VIVNGAGVEHVTITDSNGKKKLYTTKGAPTGKKKGLDNMLFWLKMMDFLATLMGKKKPWGRIKVDKKPHPHKGPKTKPKVDGIIVDANWAPTKPKKLPPDK